MTAALVLLAVHHRRVLSWMSQPLRMDEKGPRIPLRDFEVCQMSNKAPPNEEVAARV